MLTTTRYIRLRCAVAGIALATSLGSAVAAPAAALPAAPAVEGIRPAGTVADYLASVLPSRLASPKLAGAPGAVMAVDVLDGSTGRTLYSRGSFTPARPASTMKLVTATVALVTMGAERTLPTRVRLIAASGPPGSRTASIALVGGGDALLTSSDLDRLARVTVAKLRDRGITTVRMFIDDTLFPPPTRAQGWPSTYGLDVVRPVRPLVRDARLLDDVAADAGRYFATRITAQGATAPRVTASYAGRQRTTSASTTISRVVGHTVGQVIGRMLRVSENQDAEMLFRLSARASGRPATWSGGAATVRSVLSGLAIPTAGAAIYDGSGASRDNRLEPRTLSVLLRRALSTSHPELWPLYYGRLMTIAGRTGSLRDRYVTAPSKCAAVVTVAKTGALRDVLSLSGVTVGTDGAPRVFTIILQNPPITRYGGTSVRVAIDGIAATVNGCW